MKQSLDDLPPATELEDIFPDDLTEEVWRQMCATEIMEAQGIPLALQAAVLEDQEATERVFKGI
jgi:hypothetical protein